MSNDTLLCGLCDSMMTFIGRTDVRNSEKITILALHATLMDLSKDEEVKMASTLDVPDSLIWKIEEQTLQTLVNSGCYDYIQQRLSEVLIPATSSVDAPWFWQYFDELYDTGDDATGRGKCQRLIITHPGVDVNAMNRDGETLFMHCAVRANYMMPQYLIVMFGDKLTLPPKILTLVMVGPQYPLQAKVTAMVINQAQKDLPLAVSTFRRQLKFPDSTAARGVQ